MLGTWSTLKFLTDASCHSITSREHFPGNVSSLACCQQWPGLSCWSGTAAGAGRAPSLEVPSPGQPARARTAAPRSVPTACVSPVRPSRRPSTRCGASARGARAGPHGEQETRSDPSARAGSLSCSGVEEEVIGVGRMEKGVWAGGGAERTAHGRAKRPVQHSRSGVSVLLLARGEGHGLPTASAGRLAGPRRALPRAADSATTQHRPRAPPQSARRP